MGTRRKPAMPLLWLRVAIVLYAVGMIHALLLLLKKEWLARVAVPAIGLGMVFHFVSLTEVALTESYLFLLTIRHAESAMALLIGCVFMFMFVRYRTASPGIFMFPLMFFLTFASEMAQLSDNLRALRPGLTVFGSRAKVSPAPKRATHLPHCFMRIN